MIDIDSNSSSPTKAMPTAARQTVYVDADSEDGEFDPSDDDEGQSNSGGEHDATTTVQPYKISSS